MCWFCADTPISIQPQHGNMLVCESTVAQEEQVSFLRKKKKKTFSEIYCTYLQLRPASTFTLLQQYFVHMTGP